MRRFENVGFSPLRLVSGALRGVKSNTKTALQHQAPARGVCTTAAVRASQQNSDWSYFHGGGSIKLIGVTIGQLLEQRTNQNPGAEAFVFLRQGVRSTFEQVLQQSDQFAAGLVSLGLERGDRIGIWSPNCIEWIIAQFAAARAGLILVNVNPSYQAFELKHCLLKVGMKALVMPESFKTQNYHQILAQICPELDSSPVGMINSKTLPELKLVVMISPKPFPGSIGYADVMSSAGNQQLSFIKDLQDQIQFDDAVNIQFTSESKICVPVPLYHCFGNVGAVLQAILHGTTNVYPAPSFEPEATLHAVQQERCTALYGTPTMFIDMIHHPKFSEFNLKSLSTGIMAGSSCPIKLIRQVIGDMHMPKITIAYGSTEISPLGTQTMTTDSLEKRVETVGSTHANVETKIIDEKGRIVRIGETGEVCFRGYGTMLCYWGDQEQTDRAITKDRWYKTGDIGVLDKEGYLRIIGRIKDMIIRGGENIYPSEIENFLYKHPKVSEIHVIGVPDERLGEQVAAWIRVKPGEKLSAEEVKDYCKGQIAHYKIPSYISFVNEYPMTVTGKVQKYRMREMAVKMYGLDKTDRLCDTGDTKV